ncbi:MAG: HPr family phosphocarrier protein [Thermoguttaceae bacterium]
MSETAFTRTVLVANSAGLHARAAAMIATLARRFKARVTLAKGNNLVEGTEVLQILSLGAAPGEKLSLEATGEEAQQALDSLEELFRDKFGEE